MSLVSFGAWICRRATYLEESKILRTLHPTLLHANKKGSISHFCACKRSEKEFSMLRGFGGMVLGVKKMRRVLSLGVCAKPSLLGFLPQGLGREKNKKKIVSSSSFFHLFFFSKNSFLTFEKVLEI